MLAILLGIRSSNRTPSRFFKQPFYDPKVAKFADDTKQPFAITELLSAMGGVPPLPYTGPVMVGNHEQLVAARRS